MNTPRSHAMISSSRVLAVAVISLALLPGCAVHYYDSKNGIEHLWGFGHLKMQAVPRMASATTDTGVLLATNAVMAYVTGVRTLGVNVGAGSEFGGVAAGWDSRSRIVIRQPDSAFYILWPTNSVWLPEDLSRLFNLRIGPEFPHANGCDTGMAPARDNNHDRKP